MYTRLSELKNLSIDAVDGEIGRCRDFLFDDQRWTVRYIEVNTRRWLLGRRVLLSPASLGIPDIAGGRLPVSLSKEEIEKAPGLHEDQPVSRQYEADYADYFGQQPYWIGSGIWGLGAYPGDLVPRTIPVPTPDKPADERATDLHLRSASEVTGYRISAVDGELGEVSDFMIDTRSWSIVFVVLDTRRWLPGRTVLLPVAWARDISWADRCFGVDVSVDAIKSAPELQEPVSVEAIKAYLEHFERYAREN
tara:strand:+ start:2651 stop:3400 length:750 start_codon:yes stop_codon:yes gene_type:complete